MKLKRIDKYRNPDGTYTANGKTLSISEWAKELGINESTLQRRLARNWPLDKALFQKPRSKPGPLPVRIALSKLNRHRNDLMRSIEYLEVKFSRKLKEHQEAIECLKQEISALGATSRGYR